MPWRRRYMRNWLLYAEWAGFVIVIVILALSVIFIARAFADDASSNAPAPSNPFVTLGACVHQGRTSMYDETHNGRCERSRRAQPAMRRV
jgi:hypothetical protein